MRDSRRDLKGGGGADALKWFSMLRPARRMAGLAIATVAATWVHAQAQTQAPAPLRATPEATAASATLASAVTPFAGFYRFPALHGDQVWFTAEGDLWRVGAAGGSAARVTTHPGQETRAELSPDGRRVAFVGAYEGPSEAYVMPADGGVPKRLTWDGQGVAVWGWTPAGEVLATLPSLSGQPVRQLVAIDPASGRRRVLPAAQASDGAVSTDGRTLYFTRGGLRGDNARAYRGGAMARLWALDLASNGEARPLLAGADADANTRRPMPYRTPQGERIAFLSDRDGSVNLWSVDARGGDARQHTHHRADDIRHAGLDGAGGPRVVYALGADLRLIDLASGVDQPLAVTLGGDRDLQRLRWVKRPQPYLTGSALAPDGERVALTVRGHLATLGVGALRRAELPVPADARCREAAFSHDGRQLFALCDISGEVEAWRFAANGSGAPVQITHGADTLRTGLFPSPDGRWLAHTDKEGRLGLTSLATGGGREVGQATHLIDQARYVGNRQVVAWSPDSRALVFNRTGGGGGNRDQLVLHTLATASQPASTLPLTSDRYDSASPSFTPDGKWLYFLSDRAFSSSNRAPWGDRNFGPYFDRRTRVYALALQPGLRSAFQPRDELDPAQPAPRPPAVVTATAAVGAASATVSVTPAPAPAPAASAASSATRPKPGIVVDGLPGRLFEVPLAPGNYTRLVADDKRLYLLETDGGPDRRSSLRTLAVDNNAPQPELFAADVADFALTPDGRRLLVVRSAPGDATGDILLLDAAPKLPPDVSKNQVRWTDWQLAVDPRAEWRQMFNDAWRLHRDFFYDREMNGVDWPAMKRRFEPLLARVGDRAELNELLAQMVGNLNTLHSQVFTRDLREGPDEIAAAGLGARFTKLADGFRIDRIYRGDAELPSEAGPLLAASLPPGSEVLPREGDVVITVNGRPARVADDLSELLRGQVGRQTLLGWRPAAGGAERQAIVLPVSAEREAQLRTGDWEQTRAQRAAERSAGRVGYLRLRAMGRNDIGTFAREFYAQIDREALVIDVRGNNGGNIDSWVIEKLLRRAWAFWQTRSPAGTPPYPNMQQTFSGQLAVLIDEDTYSDGETFAEGIQRLRLGTLVGTRSTGAGVWLSDQNRLVDNGLMRAAESAQFAADGTWLIEGRGVRPDIEVDNLPRATFDGGDAQLDAAVDHLLQRLAAPPQPARNTAPLRR